MTRSPALWFRLLRAIRTARHLRFLQLFYWPLRRVQMRLPLQARSMALTPDSARLLAIQARVIAWGPGIESERIATADAIAGGTFRLLNRSLRLDPVDWNRRYESRLWTYHLHYFDFAIDLAWAHRLTGDARYAEAFAALAQSWISGTRPGRGEAWDPYVISVRVVNWIYALALFGPTIPQGPAALLWESIGSQLDVLDRRLEFHLLANHLLRNYRALLLGGLALAGRRASRWLKRGTAGLWSEFAEQTLPDGGHYERSPMYHASALNDGLESYDLCRACNVPTPVTTGERLRSMVEAMGVLSRPNGDLHLFNDAANNIAPNRSRLDQLSRVILGSGVPSPSGAMELPQTGYWGFADESTGERLLVDCGELGPEYQPGHSHCDALSFELDLGGRRVIVDSGTSGYDDDPYRPYQRSTRAHNTVEIDGREQSEIWGTFRMARRARVERATAEISNGVWRFTGAYHPFHDNTATHERRVERTARAAWRVTDCVSGTTSKEMVSRLHFHPDFSLVRAGETIIAAAGKQRLSVRPFGVEAVAIRQADAAEPAGWFSPEFGIVLPTAVLEMRITANGGQVFGFEIRVDSA